MLSEEDLLIPLALFTHACNIVMIFILILLFYRFIGLEGLYPYILTSVIFVVFAYKEMRFLVQQHHRS